MGDGAPKHGSNKEVQAVLLNQKQQRILEKTLQTIDLEESYAVKLLALGGREIRLRQSNLQTRVSKIKSYLEPQDVKEIRQLEIQGKLKPMYTPLNTNSALRISATAKRLNMGPDGKALLPRPRVNSAGPHSRTSNNHSSASERLNGKRHSSLVGVFIDVKERPRSSYQRRSSVDTSSSVVFRIEHPRSRSPSLLPTTARPGRASRPITSNGFLAESPGSSRTPRSKTSAAVVPPGAASHGYIETSPSRCFADISPRIKDPYLETRTRENSFSSGSRSGTDISRPVSQRGKTRSNSESSESKSLSRCRTRRRQSSFSLGSFDEQAKERMQEELADQLEMQQIQSSEIYKKKNEFMKKINQWVEENPSVVKHSDDPFKDMADSKINQPAASTSLLGDHLLVRKNNDKSSVSEQWTDLRKCRYLRIPDNKIDYSGVNTLVRDQMVLYKSPFKDPIKEEQEVL